MNFLGELLYGADSAAKLILLVLMLRGAFRKYPVFLAYAAASLLADVLEEVVYYRVGWTSHAYRYVYWTDRMVLDLFLFLLVTSLTYEALRGNPLRPMAAKVLSGIVVIGLALPLTMINSYRSRTYGVFSSQWFNHAGQIFNFAAAIMNLVLWTALLTNRRNRDRQLVILSVGLGIITASAAIAWGMRQFLSEANRWPLDGFMNLAEMAGVVIWCHAFRRKSGQPTPAPPAPPSTPSAPAAPPLAPTLTTPSQV